MGKGKCTINMSGGTLGVPRTLGQIAAHPVTCYLFGGGKGDQRTFFNDWTNVNNTEVTIKGTARIYGSVFGGGEDGHVLGDTKVTIGKVETTTGEGVSLRPTHWHLGHFLRGRQRLRRRSWLLRRGPHGRCRGWQHRGQHPRRHHARLHLRRRPSGLRGHTSGTV